MLSSKEIAICINNKLDSMTLNEKEEYFRRFGFEVVKASVTPQKKKTRKRPKYTSARKGVGGRTYLVAASMSKKNNT